MILDKATKDVQELIACYQALGEEEKSYLDADLSNYLDYLTENKKISTDDIFFIAKLIYNLPLEKIEKFEWLLDFSQQTWFVFCKQNSKLYFGQHRAKQQFAFLLSHSSLDIIRQTFELIKPVLLFSEIPNLSATHCLELINRDMKNALGKLILLLEKYDLMTPETLQILMPYVASIPENFFEKTLEQLSFTIQSIAKAGLLNLEHGFENFLSVLNNPNFTLLGAGYKSMGCPSFINPGATQTFFDELFNKHTQSLFQNPYMHVLWQGLMQLEEQDKFFMLMGLISHLNSGESDVQTSSAFTLLGHPNIFRFVMLKYDTKMSDFHELNTFIHFHIERIAKKNLNAKPVSLSKNDAEFYYLIVRYLLKQNNAENYPLIRQLLRVPSIAKHAHFSVGDFPDNDLFQHAINSSHNRDAAILLLTLPNVRSRVIENDYYTHKGCGLDEVARLKRKQDIQELMQLAAQQKDFEALNNEEEAEEDTLVLSALSP